MRKSTFLIPFLLALGVAQAATTSPPQLISPAGSSAGQAIVSTGPSTPPAWGGISLSGGVSGTLPIANGGTNATTAAAARSNLSVPGLTTSNTFTGNQVISLGNPTIYINDTSGVSSASLLFQNTGSSRWGIAKSGADNFRIDRYSVAGALVDNPFSISLSTGVATLLQRPIFGTATPWDSANLASPAQTTGATFTGAITPSQTAGIVGTTTNNNANAGSVGEYATATGAGVALTNNVAANGVSISLTAGDWDVDGVGLVDAAGGAVVGGVFFSIGTTSATLTTPRTALLASLVANGSAYLPCPTVRISIASTTTVYLVVQASFSSGTATGNGIIRARPINHNNGVMNARQRNVLGLGEIGARMAWHGYRDRHRERHALKGRPVRHAGPYVHAGVRPLVGQDQEKGGEL